VSLLYYRCNKKQSIYVCPKCSIGYCSTECYKSTAHLECSEMFYKQCIEEELRVQQSAPEMRQKTLNMLQKIYDEEVDDDMLKDILQEDDDNCSDSMGLDSDDDNVKL
jgi:hypothetical protein